jgi:hypothetical protein
MLLAALLVLAPVCAMAADVAYETYQNEANGYSIDYPAEWTILSKETLQSTMDALTSGETKIEGMDSSVFEAYKAQIESMDMVMFMSADGAVNANINYQAMPTKLTGELIVSSVYVMVVQQLQAAFADYALLADPQIEKVGDYEFVLTAGQYTLSGVPCIMMQAYHCTEKNLYTITYTINTSLNPDMDALDVISDAMLASFVPV